MEAAEARVLRFSTKTTEDLQFACRLMGHAWDTFTPVEFHGTSMWRRSFHLRCVRCGTIRHDALDSRGQLMTRRYEYPDEYRMQGEERPTSDDLRLWMFKRNRALGVG